MRLRQLVMRLRRPVLSLLPLLLLSLCAPACAQDATPTRIPDVIYRYKLGVALTMDVFKPAKPSGIGILIMMSGGWVSSHEALNPGLAKLYTDRGETVFEVVHGSQPKFTLPEIVEDIHRAVRFVRTHAAEYGVDPNRLGITGFSSGGHLSLMAAAYATDGNPKSPDPVERSSSALQAVACFFPPTDFLNYGAEGANVMKIDTLKVFWPVFGIPADASPDVRDKWLRALSPIYGVTAKMPPTLIFHGDADTLVPIQQSQRFLAKLDELKIPHQLIIRHGKGHGWPELPADIPIAIDWFEKYLAKPAP